MHVIDTLNPGGAERMLVDLANNASADGNAVSICVTRHGCPLAERLRPEIGLLVLGRQRRFEWAAIRRFAAQTKAESIDLLHVHGLSSFKFAALARNLGLFHQPILVHDHGPEPRGPAPVWFRWARRWVSQYVGVEVRLGQWAEQVGIPHQRVSVIANALDLVRLQEVAPLKIRTEVGLDAHVAVGIVVANIRPEKGIHLLLHALARCSRRQDLRILIVGRDADRVYADNCRAVARKLGLNQHVLFLGERMDAARLIRSVDFAVMPSVCESGPIVLIEYMALGVPFVSSLVGEIGKHAAHLGVPEFVAANDSVALADALDALVSLSPEQRAARGRQGKQIAEAHFDIRRAMPEWYRIYMNALETAA